MQKFKKKLTVLGSIGIVIVGGLSYNLLNKPDDLEVDQNKKEMIAMYIQDEEGNYQMSTSKEFPKEGYVLNLEKSTCKNGGILSQDPKTKVISLRVSHADACNLYFDKDLPKIEIGDKTIPIQDSNPNFANPATTDETADGLFSMEDDYGTSYYYRGTAPNNYVKFGKDASGQDMWWRIIRFNGDGSIRMQYDGVGTSGTNTYTRGFALSNQQQWDTYSSDAKYVGWMYGGTKGTASSSKEEAQRNETNSDIKTAVDNWYKTNIVDTGYGNYVHDAIFCNDRSTLGNNASDVDLGYGKKLTEYGAFTRLVKNRDNPQPQFTCPQDNDKFTVNVENEGNGNSTYPVGLITADEIVAAGSGKEGVENQSYYLYKNSWYWTFSPCFMNQANSETFLASADMFLVSYTGSLNHTSYVLLNILVAPVINLKPEYLNQIEGTGTASDPYYLPSV